MLLILKNPLEPMVLLVTEYQYEQNNHSDSQFIQEHLAQMDNQEERTV